MLTTPAHIRTRDTDPTTSAECCAATARLDWPPPRPGYDGWSENQFSIKLQAAGRYLGC